MKKSVQVVPNLFWMIDSLETLQKIKWLIILLQSYFLTICINNRYQCFATFSISITIMKKKRELQNLMSANTMSSSLTVSTIGPVQSYGQWWSAFNQLHDPASEYRTILDSCTCTCPDLLHRGPWCNQLAVSSHQAKHAARNTLDRLLGSYKNCTIKQSDLDAITNPFSRDRFL